MKPGRRALCLVSLALCLTLVACRRATTSAPDPQPIDPPWSGITLDLTPDPVAREVGVSVEVSADRARGVRELHVARAWAGTEGARAILGARARDAVGPIALEARTGDEAGPDAVFLLSRAAAGALTISYRAASSTSRAPLALHVEPEGMSGVGHAFLLLPRIADDQPVRIRFHLEALPRGAEGASSFGFGSTVTATGSSDQLAHAAFVAGMLWREASGSDELVVIGDPAFDTKSALDRTESARAALDRFFGSSRTTPAPMRFLFVGRPGLSAGREGVFLTRSIGVWFDKRDTFGDDLALVVAHELTHAFLGGRVRLTCPDGREAGWFAEGFTVHASRQAMLAAGLLSPEGFAADVDRLHGSPTGGVRLPDDYRRGAALAAQLDHAIRRDTADRARLSDALRDLVRVGGDAPVSALVGAVRARSAAAGVIAERGAARLCAGEELDRPLADGVFGACARRRASDERDRRELRELDIGFDPESVARSPKIVRGVVRGSVAEAAGVEDGALVLRADLPRAGDASPTVDLLLGDGRRIRYAATTARRGPRWTVGDAAVCRAEATSR